MNRYNLTAEQRNSIYRAIGIGNIMEASINMSSNELEEGKTIPQANLRPRTPESSPVDNSVDKIDNR